MHISTVITNAFLFFALYIQVLLLFTFLEKKDRIFGKKQKVIEDAGYRPTVSIIVPCFNEERSLKGTVLSLLALDYPKDKLQIVIVDDGSTDKTLSVAKKFAKNPQIRVLHKENGGKHTALNLGIKETASDLVGCLDADSFVDTDALLEIVKVFQNPDIMAVTPAIKVHTPKNVLQRMQKVDYDMGIFLRKIFGEMNALHVTPGPFSIFRRSVFEMLGGYRKAYNTEDMEFAMRMHMNHYPIANAHRAYVRTITPATVKALYKQRLRWVYGFLKNAFDYRHMMFNKRYGNLGMVTLPAAVASIVSALFFTGLALYTGAHRLWDRLVEFNTVGLRFSWELLKFDWFFLNTSTTAMLVYALLVTTVTVVFLGRKMSEGTYRIGTDVAWFLFLYGLLAPLWLFKAVYNVIFGKTAAWR